MTDESVFAAALAIGSPADRAAFLDRACAGDPARRREIEQLLAAHAASNPLDRPPQDLARTGAHEPGADDVGPAASVGDRVGPYKLLERIGEGGMGEVWVADQLEPIKRRVALKLIKPGMDSRSVLGRFEAERQALAVMDHPNIAKVLDAGTTPDGRPFFVMELVKGTPITEFCDARRLTPGERLELFVRVCQAIQHAHQKGIIHRDIKPSNVLVELHDDRAVAKVIDFGVAKAVGQRLTEKTVYTGFGALVGTPAYMAPEQATFNALDVDTRADVYALGVLLYELLAGSPPIESDRMRKAALDEILRIVRDEEPPRPSQRLSTSQAKATIAATRQSDPLKLSQLMKGELDWIVMRALEKDRTRRYDTATALARDVQRYLAGDAVEACPPTLGYRLKKAYRRNRAAVLVGGAFAAVLLAAAGVSVAFGLTAKRAEGVAELERSGAETARGEAVEQRDAANRRAVEVAAERDKTKAANAQLRVAQDRTRRLLYTSQIYLAHSALNERVVLRAAQLLDEARPNPGETDLRGWEWHHLDGLLRADREFRLGGSDGPSPKDGGAAPVWPAMKVASAFSRDGTLAVTPRVAGPGFVYEVWDARTGRRLGQVPEQGALPADGSVSPALSTDGQYLLVLWQEYFDPAATDNVASPTQCRGRLWEVKTGRELAGPREPLRSVRDQFDVVVGPGAAWVQWVEVPGARQPQMLPQPTEVTVARWDRQSGAVSRSRAFKPGSGSGTLRLLRDGRGLYWRPDSGAPRPEKVGNEPSRFECWDLTADPPRLRYDPIPHSSGRPERAISADGGALAVRDQRDVLVFRLSDGKELWRVPVPAGLPNIPPATLHVSPDGTRLVFKIENRFIVQERNAKGGTETREILFRDPTGNTQLLADGRTMVGLTFSSGEVRIWDVTRDRTKVEEPIAVTDVLPPPRPGGAPKFDPLAPRPQRLPSPDGRLIVEWEAPGFGPGRELPPSRLATIRTAKGELVAEIQPEPDHNWLRARFLVGGRRLLLESRKTEEKDGRRSSVSRWDLYDTAAKPVLVASGNGSVGRNSDAVFVEHPDRSDANLVLRDGRTGGVITRIGTKDSPAHEAGFDPTGNAYFVFSFADVRRDGVTTSGTLSVTKYEAATGKLCWAQTIGECLVSSDLRTPDLRTLTFSPDGKRVLVTYRTPAADRLWVGTFDGVRAHDVLLREKPPPTKTAKGDTVAPWRVSSARVLGCSPDSRHVVLDVNSEVYVWNLDTGERTLRIPAGLRAGAATPAFSPDGTRLFTRDTVAIKAAAAPTRLRVWDLTTGRELLALSLSDEDRFSGWTSPGELAPGEPRPTAGLRLEDGKLYVPVSGTGTRGFVYRVFDGTPAGK